MMAVMMVILAPRAVASAERIKQVLGTEPVGRRPGDAGQRRPRRTAVVELRDVVFGYPGGEQPVLHDLSFTLAAGRDHGHHRRHGLGQDDAAQPHPALLRRRRAAAVLVDGVDVRDMARRSCWARIGLVPQQAYLFAGTVADNLRYGREDASDEELWRRARDRPGPRLRRGDGGRPRGARSTQGGTNVSGGQRQRLAIARALVQAAEHLPLRRLLLGAGRRDRRAAACRPEARRPRDATVRHRGPAGEHHPARRPHHRPRRRAHRRAWAPHDELMSTCDEYREIVMSQLGEEAA